MACKEGKHVDWERLKAKLDHGADFVLTQLFFDNRDFLEFRDYMTGKLGVTAPISPGILPIMSGPQLKRLTAMCGARVPEAVLARLNELGNDTEKVEAFGIEHATRQCEELLREGVPGLHLYTLNKVRLAAEILKNLGLA